MIKYKQPKKIKVVDRDDYLISRCTGKKVLHLGCTDSPVYEEQFQAGRLLHPKLLNVADDILGLDVDGEAVKWLEAKCGGRYIVGDLEDSNAIIYQESSQYDVFLLPDVIEHVGNAQNVVNNINLWAKSRTELIVTTPNAYSAKGFLRAILRSEVIHPDHVSFHSFYTLSNLLLRCGWTVKSGFTFFGGGSGWNAKLSNFVLRAVPSVAEGLGLVLVKESNS